MLSSPQLSKNSEDIIESEHKGNINNKMNIDYNIRRL